MQDRDGNPYFEPALFVKTWLAGGIILVDEFNFYSRAIQEVLAEFARGYNKNKLSVSIGISAAIVCLIFFMASFKASRLDRRTASAAPYP